MSITRIYANLLCGYPSGSTDILLMRLSGGYNICIDMPRDNQMGPKHMVYCEGLPFIQRDSRIDTRSGDFLIALLSLH